MREVVISPTFASWQNAARDLLHSNVPPSEIIWRDRSATQNTLFSTSDRHQVSRSTDQQIDRSFKVPRRFLEVAGRVCRHRDDRKWCLLYSVLWRTVRQNLHLIDIRVDDEVSRLLRMHWEVGADAHRMKALLRFRRVSHNEEGAYIAWYKPDHLVVPLVAPHFTDKFATMQWAILTPDCCAHWDTFALTFSPGVDQSRAPQDDELEGLWKAFYKATFNPARLSMKTMRSEMPVRFWNNLPETQVIPRAVADAPGDVKRMLRKTRRSSEPGLAE